MAAYHCKHIINGLMVCPNCMYTNNTIQGWSLKYSYISMNSWHVLIAFCLCMRVQRDGLIECMSMCEIELHAGK